MQQRILLVCLLVSWGGFSFSAFVSPHQARASVTGTSSGARKPPKPPNRRPPPTPPTANPRHTQAASSTSRTRLAIVSTQEERASRLQPPERRLHVRRKKAWRYRAGQSYWGRNNYIQFVAGDMPIVISVPHGGTLMPAEIPARSYGIGWKDVGSHEFSMELAHQIYRLTGRRPHLVFNHLHRNRLDANRALQEAAQGSKWATQAWNEFHHFIDAAKQWITARYRKGHYFDIHTHGHVMGWIELGYRLTTKELTCSDKHMNTRRYHQRSSLRHLSHTSSLSFAELLRGPSSLGGYLQAHGYPAVPSPRHPNPSGYPYYHGGYNTERHGSLQGGVINGTQIENSVSFTRDRHKRGSYAKALAASILSFVEKQYGFSLRLPRPIKPPSHSFCKGAKVLSFVNGRVDVRDTTWGAVNEFQDRIRCAQASGMSGPQVYYKVYLQPAHTYELSIQSDFPARVYLFQNSCKARIIQKRCDGSQLSGHRIAIRQWYRKSFQIPRAGWYVLAVDSRQEAWFGNFHLSLQQRDSRSTSPSLCEKGRK